MTRQREHWGTHLGFMLAAAGSAIGLGTLWKFPYVTGQNGGGLFVLIYIFCTFFIGIPVFIAELILGRRAQRGAVGIFIALGHSSGLWKGVGWLGVLTSFILISYYSVVAGWGLNYTLMSLNQFYQGKSAQEITAIFNTFVSSGDIVLFWHCLFMALNIGVVYQGIRHGVEYWSKFMTMSLLAMLVVLLAYSFTLEGWGQAAHFLFFPDYSEFRPSGVIEALGLAFFTLSLGQGIMLTYGSYMRSTEDIPKTAAIIGVMIIAVSLMAGMTIFPIIFSFGFEPASGPGLVFQTLPLLFGQLPGALLVSTLFFTLFSFTALTSSIAMLEVLVANFMDLEGWSRQKSVLVAGIGALIFGIPSALSFSGGIFNNWPAIYGKTFFDTMNDLVSIWMLPIGGLLTALFVGWVLDKEISRDEFIEGSTWGKLWKPWMFFMRWVTPVAIVAIILQQAGFLDIDQLFGKV